ncbi:MAG: L-histidine N(alpha)-methyltransferase [Vicinamibacterales bacterium]
MPAGSASRSASRKLALPTLIDTFAADVARDLQRHPRQLQSQYLYDALGSSLFDAICRLPWYRITRSEAGLLARHAAEIASRTGDRPGDEVTIIELGVGSGEKLATLIAALPPAITPSVHLIDISSAALDATAARLSGLSRVAITRHEGTYEQGLEVVARATWRDRRKLLLFLGSNIGNFDAPASRDLLCRMRKALAPGGFLLLGADLVKPEADLLLAYDDPLGVTAAFNKNLLARINRELGGNFDLKAFEHQALWNERDQRVEMHLVCRVRQDVRIPAAGIQITFMPDETIWTESSYKYTEEELDRIAADAGFFVSEQWTDPDARFALSLLQVR